MPVLVCGHFSAIAVIVNSVELLDTEVVILHQRTVERISTSCLSPTPTSLAVSHSHHFVNLHIMSLHLPPGHILSELALHSTRSLLRRLSFVRQIVIGICPTPRDWLETS